MPKLTPIIIIMNTMLQLAGTAASDVGDVVMSY